MHGRLISKTYFKSKEILCGQFEELAMNTVKFAAKIELRPGAVEWSEYVGLSKVCVHVIGKTGLQNFVP